MVTSLEPPTAYVHNDMAVMFATLPYSLKPNTLGEAFESRVHLTNYDINARTSNIENYMADKPGIGKGCLWDARRLERWIRANRPDLSVSSGVGSNPGAASPCDTQPRRVRT